MFGASRSDKCSRIDKCKQGLDSCNHKQITTRCAHACINAAILIHQDVHPCDGSTYIYIYIYMYINADVIHDALNMFT